MDQDLKEKYCELIKEIFSRANNNSFGFVTPNHITQTVADRVDKMVIEIVKCSRRIAYIGTVYESIYGLNAANGVKAILKKLAKNVLKVWLSDVQKTYQGCLTSTVRNHASALYMEFLGI